MSINVMSYGAVGDGMTNDTVAVQLAIDTAYAAGTSVYVPKGRYLVDTLNMPFSFANTLNQGNYIYGDGPFSSIFAAASNNTTIFNWSQPVADKFQFGVEIVGLGLDSNGKSNCIGLRPHAVYNTRFKDLYIREGFKNCVEIKNQGNPGDVDACNHLMFDACRLEGASNWGIFSDLRSGNNENSFIHLRNTTINRCGTAAGQIGGGIYWRGQMLQFDSSAIVTCVNRGLYIEGGAGLGSNILANSLTFENNTGMSIQCYGITVMEFNNLQIYNNDNYKANYGIWLNAQSLIANVRVNSAKIRATSGNTPYTAFAALGANLGAGTIVVDDKQVRWDLFGAPGQTKYSGWTVV